VEDVEVELSFEEEESAFEEEDDPLDDLLAELSFVSLVEGFDSSDLLSLPLEPFRA
jgi:hypothetical protein